MQLSSHIVIVELFRIIIREDHIGIDIMYQ